MLCKLDEVDAILRLRERDWILVAVLPRRIDGGLLRDYAARELYFERREPKRDPDPFEDSQ